MLKAEKEFTYLHIITQDLGQGKSIDMNVIVFPDQTSKVSKWVNCI